MEGRKGGDGRDGRVGRVWWGGVMGGLVRVRECLLESRRGDRALDCFWFDK